MVLCLQCPAGTSYLVSPCFTCPLFHGHSTWNILCLLLCKSPPGLGALNQTDSVASCLLSLTLATPPPRPGGCLWVKWRLRTGLCSIPPGDASPSTGTCRPAGERPAPGAGGSTKERAEFWGFASCIGPGRWPVCAQCHRARCCLLTAQNVDGTRWRRGPCCGAQMLFYLQAQESVLLGTSGVEVCRPCPAPQTWREE